MSNSEHVTTNYDWSILSSLYMWNMSSKIGNSEVNFVRELPTVFNILKNNPEAIVDDTAIERLLSWLEEICRNNKSKEFIDVCLVFLQSEELWNHKVTAAFGLRYDSIQQTFTCSKSK